MCWLLNPNGLINKICCVSETKQLIHKTIIGVWASAHRVHWLNAFTKSIDQTEDSLNIVSYIWQYLYTTPITFMGKLLHTSLHRIDPFLMKVQSTSSKSFLLAEIMFCLLLIANNGHQEVMGKNLVSLSQKWVWYKMLPKGGLLRCWSVWKTVYKNQFVSCDKGDNKAGYTCH